MVSLVERDLGDLDGVRGAIAGGKGGGGGDADAGESGGDADQLGEQVHGATVRARPLANHGGNPGSGVPPAERYVGAVSALARMRQLVVPPASPRPVGGLDRGLQPLAEAAEGLRRADERVRPG